MKHKHIRDRSGIRPSWGRGIVPDVNVLAQRVLATRLTVAHVVVNATDMRISRDTRDLRLTWWTLYISIKQHHAFLKVSLFLWRRKMLCSWLLWLPWCYILVRVDANGTFMVTSTLKMSQRRLFLGEIVRTLCIIPVCMLIVTTIYSIRGWIIIGYSRGCVQLFTSHNWITF